MEKMITSADLGKVIYIDPSKQSKVTLTKVPRKLKKKLKKLGKYPPDTKKILIEIMKGDEELGLYDGE